MTSDVLDVIRRYPELQAGIPDYVDEVCRIAARIVELETNPPSPPELPECAIAHWERAYWHRRDSAKKASAA